MSGTITWKVDLILRLMDGATFEYLSSPVQFLLNGEAATPILKSGGYYVFTNLYARQVRVEIKAYGYHVRTLDVQLDQLPPLEPVVTEMLCPNLHYATRPGTPKLFLHFSDLQGRGIEGIPVQIVPMVKKSTIKYARGETPTRIKLSDTTRSMAVGHLYAVVDAETEQVSVFRLQQLLESNLAEIDAPVGDFENGTYVTRIFTTHSAHTGDVFFPLLLRNECAYFYIRYVCNGNIVAEKVRLDALGTGVLHITLPLPPPDPVPPPKKQKPTTEKNAPKAAKSLPIDMEKASGPVESLASAETEASEPVAIMESTAPIAEVMGASPMDTAPTESVAIIDSISPTEPIITKNKKPKSKPTVPPTLAAHTGSDKKATLHQLRKDLRKKKTEKGDQHG